MGMGYAGSFVDVVSEDVVKEFCPEEYNNFLYALEKNGCGLDDYAGCRSDCWDAPEVPGSFEEIESAYEMLVQAFNSRTENAGLSLGYHDSNDDGDRYDDIDGRYWECTNLFKLSPAGEFLKSKFSRKFFVLYG